MRKLLRTITFAALAAPALALAQVEMEIQLNLPAVLPPLVVVEPGVRVVRDFDQEIFFVDGYYWCRHEGHWYRTRDPRARWAYAEPRYVPPGIVRHPPGHYRHWRKAEWKEEKRARKDREKAERREWKEEERAEKRERHEGHDRGHGHGHDD